MSSISDKEYYHLTISINKALNAIEAPLKIKHARSAIITTHRTKESKSFWTVIMRQPLMENRFTSWKFCHLLHKVLREGHESALKQSLTHKKMILEMGKLWGHLQDGVGNCIQSYSKLLVTKIDFHEKNTLFPGSLIINFNEIRKFAGEDINIYFQLCVEIFDYLDDIIDVQSKVFTSLNTYRMSSMTPQGQCRLAPLITLIQDSNPLYDISVRIMFKLHDELSDDILAGHRSRFRELFSKLKQFYNNVRPLQYFADLIQVPNLPESAPNFTSKVDFGSYIPPVVFVQPEPEPVDNLVDTSILEEQKAEPSLLSQDDVLTLKSMVVESELTSQQLRIELSAAKEDIFLIENNYKKEILHMKDKISELSNDLEISLEKCASIQQIKEDLETKLANTPSLLQKVVEEEEKAKVSEDKFTKLKIMYTQIRDEHINLLRQQSESVKFINKEKQVNSTLKAENELLTAGITEIKEKADMKDILCIQISEFELKIKDATKKYEELLAAYDELKKIDTSKSIEIEGYLRKTDQHQNDVRELEQCKSKIKDLEESLTSINEMLNRERDDNTISSNKYKNDLENETSKILELNKAHEVAIEIKCTQITQMQEQILLLENRLEEKEIFSKRVTDEKILIENELQDLLQQNSSLENKLTKATNDTISIVASTKRDFEIKYEGLISSLLHCVLKTMEELSLSKFDETNQEPLEKSLSLIEKMDTLLNKLTSAYQKYSEGKHHNEDLTRKSIQLGYNFAMLHEQCVLIYNTTTDIAKGQDIYQEISCIRDPLLKIFELLKTTEEHQNLNHYVNTLKEKLSEVGDIIIKLKKTTNNNVELGDLMENELQEMDKAIEEAAERIVEMLSNARTQNQGIKLEVNEKILDACTTLMECIKLLIQKSRILQEEIVLTGRGNTSVKEFYKRNSQWTEGLISASKSVAKGANLLVDAANKAVTSESNQHFELIVAAQEIAACTAQLVIASKVKAPRESQKLSDLTKASRNVSHATGTVVATVKDCNKYLEQHQDIDLSKLTSSQAKTMEMEIHVKVLELEQALLSERFKLSSFRKNHYQNTDS